MIKKIALISLLSFFVMALSAETVEYKNNNYLISVTQKEKNNKTYNTYKYFKTKEQILSENIDTITLVIVGPSERGGGSFGGHTFIALSKGDDLTNATVLSFSVMDELLDIFSPVKVIKMFSTGIPGHINIIPFSLISEKYLISENRTLFYFKIDIDKEGINRLIDKVYEEIDKEQTFQFFGKNCSLFAKLLLEAGLDMNFDKDSPSVLYPFYLPIIMNKNNLILEEGTFTPSIVRLNKEPINISKELIIEKKEFYEENHHVTNPLIDEEQFVPQKDIYDYGTQLENYISKASLGIKNNNPTFDLSLFSINKTEQRQSPNQALQINFLEMGLVYDQSIKVDSFKIFEFSSYPKINYGFDFTKKLILKGEKNINGELVPLLNGGFGISLGKSNLLFVGTTDLDIPLSAFGINLSLNSEFMLYNKDGYILLEGNVPFYQKNTAEEITLKIKSGITLLDRVNIEASYNWLNSDYEASISWNFNPFYYN